MKYYNVIALYIGYVIITFAMYSIPRFIAEEVFKFSYFWSTCAGNIGFMLSYLLWLNRNDSNDEN